MNKIYIVEDEPIIVLNIEKVLKKYHYNVLGNADNVEEAFQEISELKPSLILLDITLEGVGDGIDLAKKIDATLKIPYLFITSLSDPITLQRIKECNPIGFIVKPFTEENLMANVTLALFKEKTLPPVEIPSQNDLFVKKDNKIVKISMPEISYVEAYDNYCFLYTKTGEKHLITKTLKLVEEKLPNQFFIRIHRSFIVNLNEIESIDNQNIIVNGVSLTIGKTFKDELMQKLNIL